MTSSSCPTNFVYNYDTQLCDKFDISSPTECTIYNRDNLNFIYYPFTKKCRYKDVDNDKPIEINYDPICPPNTITMPDNKCKRFVISIPPLRQNSGSTFKTDSRLVPQTDSQLVSQTNPQLAVNIVYIILFVIFIILFFIGLWFFSKKK